MLELSGNQNLELFTNQFENHILRWNGWLSISYMVNSGLGVGVSHWKVEESGMGNGLTVPKITWAK
jgi:hypothetical protein